MEGEGHPPSLSSPAAQGPLPSHVCVPSPHAVLPLDPSDSLLYFLDWFSVVNVNSSRKKMAFQEEPSIGGAGESVLVAQRLCRARR